MAAVIFHGKRFRLNLAYDAVLSCIQAGRDPVLGDLDKLELCLAILVKNRRALRRLTPQDKGKLYEEISSKHLNVISRKAPGKQTQPVSDFVEDFDLIYSSFLFSYGIDLSKAHGKLQWREFCWLFEGLPSGCKMREVMEIRSRKIPAPTKYNQEEIRQLTELKRYWMLPILGPGNYQEQLESLFEALSRLARR